MPYLKELLGDAYPRFEELLIGRAETVTSELETRGNELWKQLETSGGLAMHIAGDFPGLALEFWAIRG